jgi:hypothetical protein
MKICHKCKRCIDNENYSWSGYALPLPNFCWRLFGLTRIHLKGEYLCNKCEKENSKQ